jgi:hypothetical protein
MPTIMMTKVVAAVTAVTPSTTMIGRSWQPSPVMATATMLGLVTTAVVPQSLH